MKNFKLRVLILWVVGLVLFSRCDKDPSSDSNIQTNAFNGDWICYNIEDFDKIHNWELYCYDSAYQDSGYEDVISHTLNIQQESVGWFMKVFAFSYSSNRPDTCGGPYIFEDTMIQDYSFQILKVEGNRIHTQVNDGQTLSEVDFIYEMLGSEELRILMVNSGENEGVGPFKYRRK